MILFTVRMTILEYMIKFSNTREKIDVAGPNTSHYALNLCLNRRNSKNISLKQHSSVFCNSVCQEDVISCDSQSVLNVHLKDL